MPFPVGLLACLAAVEYAFAPGAVTQLIAFQEHARLAFRALMASGLSVEASKQARIEEGI
jgi:hypothetical protein